MFHVRAVAVLFVSLFAGISAFADPVLYKYDDGAALNSTFGVTNQVVLVGFQVTSTSPRDIAGMQLFSYPGAPAGHAITFGLWSDPNNDGDPGNAQLVTSVDSTIVAGGMWQTAVFPSITTFNVGDWFYVGAYMSDPSGTYFMTGADKGPANGHSYQYVFDTGATGQLSNLAGKAIDVNRMGDAGAVDGNLLIRAIPAGSSALPEPSEIAVLSAGVALVVGLRRRYR